MGLCGRGGGGENQDGLAVNKWSGIMQTRGGGGGVRLVPQMLGGFVQRDD